MNSRCEAEEIIHTVRSRLNFHFWQEQVSVGFKLDFGARTRLSLHLMAKNGLNRALCSADQACSLLCFCPDLHR